MTTGPTAVMTVFASILSEVGTQLATSIGGLPGRICIAPGEIALDECDCRGTLMVAAVEQYLTDTFPHTNTTRNPVELTPCRASWFVVNAKLQISRCTPTPDDANDIVTCLELQGAASVLYSDAWVILNTLACALQTLKDTDVIVDYSMADQTIDGPDGGCVGSTVDFAIAFDRG